MVNNNDENDRNIKPQSELIDDNQQWWLRFVPKSKQWSDVNISRFLSIYKAHRILWDPTHFFYKDQPKRKKAYDIIVRRLNLYGIKKRDCMQLVESLKELYTEEKNRQMITKRCSRKYTLLPTWYHMLKELIEYVQQKLAEPTDEGSVKRESNAKPWEACYPRLYTEDIWTPEHFKTNVMNWFLTSQDDQLFCKCQQVSETTCDDICSTGTSSTYYGTSTSDSSNEINQYVAEELSSSSSACCFNTRNSDLPEQCSMDTNNGKTQTCNNYKQKKKEKMASVCNSKKSLFSRTMVNCSTVETEICENEKTPPKVETRLKNTAQCSSANTNERNVHIKSHGSKVMCGKGIDIQQVSVDEICCGKNDYNKTSYKTDNECKSTKIQQNRNTKLILCEDSTIICKEKRDVLDPCGSEVVGKSQNRIHKLREYNEAYCGIKKLPKFCTMETTTYENEERVISLNSEASMRESYNICCSDRDGTPDIASASSSRSSLLLSECITLSDKEESDHRLDYNPDPTLCEKCAVDRMPIPDVHRNVIHHQDPRMPELDKYCRYKDWDAIYNIRTQVPDEEPVIQTDEDCFSTMRSKDEPPSSRKQNHLPTDADINLFIDPKSSDARQVSLNYEYKREYGLNIQIDQPKHYACGVFEIPGHKPVQLIL